MTPEAQNAMFGGMVAFANWAAASLGSPLRYVESYSTPQGQMIATVDPDPAIHVNVADGYDFRLWLDKHYPPAFVSKFVSPGGGE